MAFSSSVDAGIAEVVFNKPPVNAFNSAEWAGIASEIKALGSRRDVHVIIVRAEGKGFCAGVDIKELGADPNMIVPVNKGNYDTFEAIHRNPKPVIVALHGFVLGGGILGNVGLCVLAVRADWRGCYPPMPVLFPVAADRGRENSDSHAPLPWSASTGFRPCSGHRAGFPDRPYRHLQQWRSGASPHNQSLAE